MANGDIQKNHETPKKLSDRWQRKAQPPLKLPPSMKPPAKRPTK